MYMNLITDSTMRTHNDYCLILAGGVGKRLWPYSRKEKPKQFLDFFGTGRSLLQQTYERFAKFIPKENIYISTFEDYVPLVCEQLPEIDSKNIFSEPVQLSTAPAVAWASYFIALRNPHANVVVTPADQHIVNEEIFASQVGEGLDFVAEHSDFLTLGVKPTIPHTGYGYIQKSEVSCCENFVRVKSFAEKPSEDFAKMFVESGEFIWNTGLFLWNVQTMKRKWAELIPAVAQHIDKFGISLSHEKEMELLNEFYPTNLHLSLDLLILERSTNVYVRECQFGWADVGGWTDLYAVKKKDADGNTMVGSQRVIFSASKDNLINLPKDTVALVDGLEGYLVSLNDKVLVICRDTELVRRFSSEARMQFGEDFA